MTALHSKTTQCITVVILHDCIAMLGVVHDPAMLPGMVCVEVAAGQRANCQAMVSHVFS